MPREWQRRTGGRWMWPKNRQDGPRVGRTTGLLVIVLGLILLASGCATVGRDFPVQRVADIRIGETTQEEIRTMFGEPWRVGLEDGQRTWTYGKYRYQLFGEASTTDLVVRFADDGTVASYSFNTTEHED